jgi:lambda family phage portal protein
MDLVRELSAGIDRLVGMFSPGAGARRAFQRAQERQALRASAAWDGASNSRRWADRSITGGSADGDLDRDDIDKLRSRSRDRWRNDGLAHGALNAMVEGIAGCGMRPLLRLDAQALGIPRERARELQRQASQLWREWCRTADACERVTMDELQSLIIGSCLMSGDTFVRPLMVQSATQPSRFELRVEVIEGDRCDTPLGKIATAVRNGIELGERGEPTHYWISREHPGDSLGARTFDRIPRIGPTGRPNVLHVYAVDRPGQSRGRPLLAPVLDAFKDLDDYIEAEVVRSQVAACFAAFVKRNDPYGAALAATASGTSSGQQREIEIVPGGIHYLQQNEDISFGSPSSPNAAWDGFVRATRQMICAPLDIPYEIAARDMRGLNYSNARAAFLLAWRSFQKRQRWAVNTFLQPLWEMLLEEAWLKGLWEAEDFAERRSLWTNTIWIASGKGWIDPLKEVQAEQVRLENALTTRSQIAAANDGLDWETEIAPQLVEEEALLAQLRSEAGVEAPQAKPLMPPPQQDNQDTPVDPSTAQETADDRREAVA